MDGRRRTFVISPGVLVRPCYELLVYPSQEPYGGIRETIPESLGPRRLLLHVAHSTSHCASERRKPVPGSSIEPKGQDCPDV